MLPRVQTADRAQLLGGDSVNGETAKETTGSSDHEEEKLENVNVSPQETFLKN